MKDLIIGIDIGGTRIKMGLIDSQGVVIDKWSIPTRTEEEGSRIIGDISDSLSEKLKNANLEIKDIYGIGVGLPGFVDEDGTAHGSVNLGWNKPFNIESELSDRLLGAFVHAGNDANVAALGEAWTGSGQGYRNMLLVTLGTGIGGGVVIDNKILAGAHSCCGEIGHICVNPQETRPCNCGRCGCLEQYASAPGIQQLMREELGMSMPVEEFWRLVDAGKEDMKRVAKRFGDYLGYGLAAASMIIDPEVFVIGGGMSMAGEVILPYIREGYEKNVLPICRNTPIRLAALGNDAGIIGAAALALGN